MFYKCSSKLTYSVASKIWVRNRWSIVIASFPFEIICSWGFAFQIFQKESSRYHKLQKWYICPQGIKSLEANIQFLEWNFRRFLVMAQLKQHRLVEHKRFHRISKNFRQQHRTNIYTLHLQMDTFRVRFHYIPWQQTIFDDAMRWQIVDFLCGQQLLNLEAQFTLIITMG